jgi:ABC-2 type transport system permease protein
MTLLRMLLRMHRGGFISVTAVGAIAGSVQALAYSAAAGSTPAQHQAFGRSVELLGRQLYYLLPLPIRPDTLPGYVEWRGLGSVPLFFGLWALLSGVGGTRGDEDRGLVETWLAAGLSRWRFLLARFGVFALAALASVFVIAVFTELGSVGAGSPLPFDRLLELVLPTALVAAWCYAFAALVAQAVASSRTAMAVAGVLIVGLYLVNALGRAGGPLGSYRGLSPFYYVDRTTALAPGGTFDVAATVGLAVTAVPLALLAALAFTRRDLGSALLRRTGASRPPVLTPDPNPLLRVPVLALLYEHRAGLLVWTGGMAILGAWMASLVKPILDLLQGAAGFAPYVAALERHASLSQAVLGAFIFPVMQLVLAIYVVTVIAGWSSDDAEGRLEMVLAEPVPRSRVVLERAGALLAGVVLLVAAGVGCAALVARSQGLVVDGTGLVQAGAALLPFGLSFGAVGAAITGRFPRLAVPALGALAVLSYFLQEFAQLFSWPSWVTNLSVFSLYGDPLDNGVYWNGLFALLAIVVVGFGVAVLALQRRDVGT